MFEFLVFILFGLTSIIFGPSISNHINTLRTVSGQHPIMMNRGRARIPFPRIPISNRPQQPPELKNTHEPTPKNCAEVKRILTRVSNFPPELVDIVMDFAEYWACSVASIDYSVTANQQFSVHGTHNEDQLLLRTEPLGLTTWHSTDHKRWQMEAPPRRLEEEYPREELQCFVEGPPSTLEHPFRKIVFDIVSRDQGHATETHTSWTWFDAGIDRFDKGHKCSTECMSEPEHEKSSGSRRVPTTCAIRPVWPPLKENASKYHHELAPTVEHMIQCNRVADRNWQHHHIEWLWTDDIDPESSAGQELGKNGRGIATGNGSFLKSLKVGDMLTVWGRARFRGWTNNVKLAQVQVYWAL
ncbi:hypothetical protein F5Y19DRAFT_440412 [Xylariaceae sp. FL1651]|nr:hypothetical protein F5Y19DRAFT_440412 [Xylariaceae sp. FL1651]